MMKEESLEILRPCSFSERSSATRTRLEGDCQEITEEVPFMFKRRKTTCREGNWVARDQVPEMTQRKESSLHKEKGSAESTTATPVPPSAEGSNNTVDAKSKPSHGHDLVDFRGLAMVPRSYASLLEKACNAHPDLVICSKRSPRWRTFAYCTLGELLCFLTSKKRRDMTIKALEHLKTLWEEAQSIGFDLSWLAPCMKSSQGAGTVVEAVSHLQEKKEVLKKRQNTLQCQLTTLTMELIEVEKALTGLDKVIQHGDKKLDCFLYTGL